MFVGLLALEQAERIKLFAAALASHRGRLEGPPGHQVGGGLSRFPPDRQARFLPRSDEPNISIIRGFAGARGVIHAARKAREWPGYGRLATVPVTNLAPGRISPETSSE